jgi:hypothetical protein
MQMTATNPSATIVETESELVRAAETVTEIENEETVAETRARETSMEKMMEHLQVTMAVHMEVQRVGVEAEVEMMTADTHVGTETARMTPAGEMETITEVVVACAHGLGAQTEISTALETAVIVMIPTLLREKTVETEMSVARAEAPSERVRPH